MQMVYIPSRLASRQTAQDKSGKMVSSYRFDCLQSSGTEAKPQQLRDSVAINGNYRY